MIANDRVAKVVGILTGVPDDVDSLDWAELLVELGEEFDAETVRTALRYVEVLAERSRSARRDGLWDEALDGGST